MSFLSSLFRKRSQPLLWTGKVLSASDVRLLLNTNELTADKSYAEVNSTSLTNFYEWYADKLSTFGVSRNDMRLDCDNFAGLYQNFSQLKYYLAQWESNNIPDAEALAVGSVWYRPTYFALAHAVNVALTERGVLYIEPQTGAIVTLSATEQASIFKINI